MGKSDDETWQDRLDALVIDAIDGLKKRQLVSIDDERSGAVSSTEFGETMSKVYTNQSRSYSAS
jgi:ATP-dependent DNA helicase HFM1/MER3